MSYILDALRRADAERDRGAVPSIHAQHFGPVADDDEAAPRSRLPLWIIVGLSIALLAAVAWNFLRPVTVPLTPALAPLPIAAPPPGAPVAQTPAVTAAPALPAPMPPSAAAATVSSKQQAAEAPVQSAPKAVRKPVARKPPPEPTADRVVTPAPRPAPSAEPAAERPAGPRVASETDGGDKRVVPLRDLPEAVRRELPSVVVGGSTYSTNSANRMLMVNGQILHEGDPVAAGVVLRQIKPHAAVLSFRGHLYEIAF